MDTERYLSQIQKYEIMMQNRLIDYYQINSFIYDINSPVAGDKVQTNCSKDKISSLIAKMVDIEKDLESIVQQRQIIVHQIESIPQTDFYDVLAKRYILKMSNQEIAYEKKESTRNISRTIDSAELEFEKVYGHLYLDK